MYLSLCSSSAASAFGLPLHFQAFRARQRRYDRRHSSDDSRRILTDGFEALLATRLVLLLERIVESAKSELSRRETIARQRESHVNTRRVFTSRIFQRRRRSLRMGSGGDGALQKAQMAWYNVLAKSSSLSLGCAA